MASLPSYSWKFLLVYLTVLFGKLQSVHRQRILVEAHSPMDEDRLLKNLTKRYNKSIRPVLNTSHAIDIAFDITFNYIIDVDEKQQILISSIWIRQEWYNELLTWDPKEYGGVNLITVPSQEIWVPDIVLYNNVFEEFDGRFDNVPTLINLKYTGHNFWAAPFVFRTSCKIDVSNFPFDEQNCKLKFGSWAFQANKVNMVRMDNRTHALQATKKVENGEWELIQIPIEKNILYYACCPDHPYVDITFKVQLRRRYLFYIINLVIPNFLITLLAFLSFLIPVDSGERISFVITVLLSMTVFLLLVAESIPSTSDAVPVIGIYFTSSIVQVALALIATAVTLRIHHSHVLGHRGLSPKMKVFLLGKLGPRLGFKTTPVHIRKESSCVSCVRLFRKMRKESTSQSTYDMCATRSAGPINEKVMPSSLPTSEVTSDEKENITPTFENHKDASHFLFETSCENASVSENVSLITRTLREQREKEMHAAECQLAAAIVDRAFMIVFVVVFISSSFIILLLPVIRNS